MFEGRIQIKLLDLVVLEHSKCQVEVYREKQLEQLVNREREEEKGLHHMVTKYQSAIPNDLVEAKFVCGEARPFKKSWW
jgi:hypothetical protein